MVVTMPRSFPHINPCAHYVICPKNLEETKRLCFILETLSQSQNSTGHKTSVASQFKAFCCFTSADTCDNTQTERWSSKLKCLISVQHLLQRQVTSCKVKQIHCEFLLIWGPNSSQSNNGATHSSVSVINRSTGQSTCCCMASFCDIKGESRCRVADWLKEMGL